VLKKPSQNYKTLHYHPLKTGTGVASFSNTFPYTKGQNLFQPTANVKAKYAETKLYKWCHLITV